MCRINLPAFLVLIAASTFAAGETMRIETGDGRAIEATILGVRNESVHVKKTDGQEFEIPLSSLAEASIKRNKEMAMAIAPAAGDPSPVKVHTEALSAAEQKFLADLYPALREWRLSELRPTVTEETRNKLKEHSAAIINPLARNLKD